MSKSNNCSPVMFVALSAVVLSVLWIPQAEAKKRPASKPGNYLVPPPPPYMPTILPELRSGSGQSVAGPANPYKKYVYSANGYEDPVPVHTHKTVTYWKPESSPVKTP